MVWQGCTHLVFAGIDVGGFGFVCLDGLGDFGGVFIFIACYVWRGDFFALLEHSGVLILSSSRFVYDVTGRNGRAVSM